MKSFLCCMRSSSQPQTDGNDVTLKQPTSSKLNSKPAPAGASASRAQAVVKSGSRVILKRNPNYKPHGPGSYVWLMKKYNIKPTQPGPIQHENNKLVKRFSDGTTGDVQASDVQNDSSYTAPVTVGTPGQTMNLDFDTGSSDLWFWSTELPQSTLSGAGQHTVFDPTKSSTFQTTQGSTWKITYGDGSGASGTVGTDNVTIGELTITAQACELANQISSQFAQDSSDGLCGLAWPTINTVSPQPVATPVENMISQDTIPASSELFTAYLGSWRDTAEADKGESWYTFGHIDQDALGGQTPEYVDIDNSQGFWMFNSPTGTVNGTSFTIGSAIADTGTTLMLVPDAACKAIYAAIPGAKYDSTQQGWLYPTSTTADQLPVVQVAFGSKMITINKEDLGYTEATAGMYYGGIQSVGSQPFSILGDVFLKNIYCIFDVGGKRLGAVQRTEATQNVAPPPAS